MAGITAPVVPVRGQVLITERMRHFTKHVVLGVEPSLRQTWAGNGLVGSTTEYVGHDKHNTLQTIRHFAQGMIATFPDLATTQIIRSWTGLRPGTPDEMPILGESEKVKGFVIATGAFRNGMLYGPAMGEVIRDVVLGKAPSINIEVARPERFEPETPELAGTGA
jgi:glycine/D-amino acid oxidase-like deaminating enzyme